MESFLELKKTKKDCSKVKNLGAGPNLIIFLYKYKIGTATTGN